MRMSHKNEILISKVVNDLESNDAKVMVIANIINDEIKHTSTIDYTIEAEFADGEKWEIFDIKELATKIVAKGKEVKSEIKTEKLS